MDFRVWDGQHTCKHTEVLSQTHKIHLSDTLHLNVANYLCFTGSFVSMYFISVIPKFGSLNSKKKTFLFSVKENVEAFLKWKMREYENYQTLKAEILCMRMKNHSTIKTFFLTQTYYFSFLSSGVHSVWSTAASRGAPAEPLQPSSWM